jgi:xanthine/uracil permease
MPGPVLGAVLLLTFATIATVGVQRVGGHLKSPRNQLVFSLSIAITIGIAVAPKATWAAVPEMIEIFISEEMIMGILCAVILDLIIPKDKSVKS